MFVVSIAMKGNCNPREYDSRGETPTPRESLVVVVLQVILETRTIDINSTLTNKDVGNERRKTLQSCR